MARPFKNRPKFLHIFSSSRGGVQYILRSDDAMQQTYLLFKSFDALFELATLGWENIHF